MLLAGRRALRGIEVRIHFSILQNLGVKQKKQLPTDDRGCHDGG
jgi:hypothetical protein